RGRMVPSRCRTRAPERHDRVLGRHTLPASRPTRVRTIIEYATIVSLRMPSSRQSRLVPLAWLPAATFIIHAVTFRGYGWFRDEFYYVACARRLAWGYVDQPPLSIVALKLILAIVGASLPAMRLTIAVVAALTVLMVGLIAREIGGGRRAQAVAMLAVIVAPEFLALNFFYSMNAFDLLLWAVSAFLVLRALAIGSRAWWAWLGLALGLGLLNKISVLWLGGGLAAGLLMTPARRSLRTTGPYLAAVIAGACFAPHILWQVAHGWPTLEFIQRASTDKMALTSAGQYTLAQLQILGPASAIIAILGLVSAFRRRDDERVRVLAWTWVAVFLILAVNGTSRAGYLAPAYTWLFAAGGVAFERWTAARSRLWMIGATALMVVSGVAVAPIALPILSVERYVAYSRALGVAPSMEEKKELAALPQFFADMNGWPEFVSDIERAWRQLPPDERTRAIFVGGNYGEAGAVDVLGPGLDVLPSFSGHNNYWFWGPPPESVDAIIVLTDHPERLQQRFDHVETAGKTECGDCMPYENHRASFVAWGSKLPWASVWPSLKHFD
ncbi:MAG: glycosyltransferase family 39 protein, partial [Vicinamibacterales bacterium]